MWKEGFWLPNGCDAAICKDTGTRSVDELKLKNMATYEIYSKEVIFSRVGRHHNFTTGQSLMVFGAHTMRTPLPCPIQAGKVALELRKARNAEAKGALQWAFGSLMKLDRSKEEAKEADAMLNGTCCHCMFIMCPCCLWWQRLLVAVNECINALHHAIVLITLLGRSMHKHMIK